MAARIRPAIGLKETRVGEVRSRLVVLTPTASTTPATITNPTKRMIASMM